jgi:hypothetical protein
MMYPNFLLQCTAFTQKLLLTCLLICAFGMFTKVNATHIVGGEMSYKFVSHDANTGQYTYSFQLLVYRDCYNGVPWFDDPATLAIYNGQNQLVKVVAANPTFVDTLPVNFQSLCNATPSGICFNVARYEITETLPYYPFGYHVVYQRCCRNGIINNLVDPLESGATYSVFLSSAAMLLHNDSPEWLSLPLTVICANTPMNYPHHAVDAEGDDIVYEFCAPLLGLDATVPLDTPTAPPYLPATFLPPYTAQYPMGGNPAVQIDAQSGLIFGTPSQSGHFVVSVCGKEYRNGDLLSVFYRDFQFIVSDCIQSAIYTSLDPAAHPVCDTVYDHISVQTQGGTPPYSYLWSDGSTGATLSNATPGQPYNLSITDAQGCLSQVSIQGNDCVWPGDANYDGVANNMDVLELGLYNGEFGPVRPNASNDWEAQPAPFWSGKVSNGRNRKHADCDGSGSVNNFDLAVIDSNYAAPSHPLAFMPVVTQNAPDLYFNLPPLSINHWSNGTIRLGTESVPAQQAYGIAFSVRSNKEQVDFSPSAGLNNAFGEFGRYMVLWHEYPDQSLMDYVIVRNNHLPLDNLYGDICLFSFIVLDGSSPGPATLQFENVRLIDHNGNSLPVNLINFQSTVGVQESSATGGFRLAPNPANGSTWVQFVENGRDNRELALFNQQGQRVLFQVAGGQESGVQLNTQTLPNGLYVLRCTQDGRVWSGKLAVQHF